MRTEVNWAYALIGCGGIEDGKRYQDFSKDGISAVQYLSPMIYRGPLAAALIAQEAVNG